MKKFYVFLLPALCVLFSGCFATRDDVSALQYQINALNASVKQQASQAAENNAAVDVKLDSIDTTLSQDLADKGELQSSISQLSARIDDLVSLLGAQLEETKSFRKELLPSQIYNNGYGQYLKKQYSSSVQSFETYIEKYPFGEHVEKALYFKGNGYLELGKNKESALAYATLMANFPESTYLAAARLRYAQAMLAIDPSKNKKEAINYYKSVMQDFPSSREAEVAKTKLAVLDPKPAAEKSNVRPVAKPVSKSAQSVKKSSQTVNAATPAAKPAQPKPEAKTPPAASAKTETAETAPAEKTAAAKPAAAAEDDAIASPGK